MTETETVPTAETSPAAEATPVAGNTLESLRTKLAESAVPLKLGELKKELPNPTNLKSSAFEAEVKRLLEEEIAAGRAYVMPSASKGDMRYWGKDEKQAIRDAVLAAASEPKTLADLKKAAKLTKADAAFADAIVDELVAEAGRIFHAPSGRGGVERYWVRDEKQTINEAIITAAAEPKTLAELKKAAVAATKADAAFADAVVDEVVSAQPGQLMRHLSGKNGAERHWMRDEKVAIREAVLAAAVEPKPLVELKKAAVAATKADKSFAEPLVDELVTTEQLHPQSTASKPKYGREKPKSPNDAATVSAALLAAAEPPQKLVKLVKMAVKSTKADQIFVESTLNALIQSKQLHPQSDKAMPVYGTHELVKPHVLDVGSGKKAFEAVVKAGHKLLETAPALPLDELFQRLRTALQQPYSPPVKSKKPPVEELTPASPHPVPDVSPTDTVLPSG